MTAQLSLQLCVSFFLLSIVIAYISVYYSVGSRIGGLFENLNNFEVNVSLTLTS